MATVEHVALVTSVPAWTDSDERSCQTAFDALVKAERDVQRKAMEEGEIMATGGSGSIAPMGAQVRCMAETKPERFCDPEQRKVFVAAVKTYIEQSVFVGAIADATEMSMNTYVPAIAAAAGTKSTEHEFGMGIVNDMTKSVGERMVASHKKVAATLRDLIEHGYMREEDFGVFMGFGVPLMVKTMLKGVKPGPSVCA
jgi:3-oxoacyl-[acyl-carrier-protein] synthase III